MKHVLFKVREGKLSDWESWCDTLREREGEAKETMRYERCTYERAVAYKRNGDWYVVGSSQFDGALRKADMNIELNQKHQEAKETCLGDAIGVFQGKFILPPEYKVLYEFSTHTS